MDYFLKTARLGFRSWSAEDLPLAIALWGDADVTALIGGPFPPHIVRERLATEIECMHEHGMQYWPIFLLSDDLHVGCAGLRPYRARVYELGIHLHRDFWARGLGAEAATAVIAYGFGTLRAEALFAGHHPANNTSRQLLLKLGFRHTHDELYPPTGLMHASYLLRNPGPIAP